MRDTVTLRLALAQLTLRAGDLGAARDNAKRVLQQEPENAEAKRVLAAAGG